MGAPAGSVGERQPTEPRVSIAQRARADVGGLGRLDGSALRIGDRPGLDQQRGRLVDQQEPALLRRRQARGHHAAGPGQHGAGAPEGGVQGAAGQIGLEDGAVPLGKMHPLPGHGHAVGASDAVDEDQGGLGIHPERPRLNGPDDEAGLEDGRRGGHAADPELLGEGAQKRVGAVELRGGHEAADAAPALDPAALAQPLQRVPGGHAADAEPVGELGLRGQQGARRQSPALLLQPLADLPVAGPVLLVSGRLDWHALLLRRSWDWKPIRSSIYKSGSSCRRAERRGGVRTTALARRRPDNASEPAHPCRNNDERGQSPQGVTGRAIGCPGRTRLRRWDACRGWRCSWRVHDAYDRACSYLASSCLDRPTRGHET